MNPRKYWIFARGIMLETLTYRLNFVMWRVRVVLQILTIYFLWLSLLPKDETLFNYSQSTMLTYILGTSFIGTIVFSTRTHSVADEINNGNLSNHLLKPASYFLIVAARDVGDKLMNIFFSVAELIIIFLLLQPQLFFQTNISFLSLTFVAVLLATLTNFFISFGLGMVGFWSNETWAPRFIFFILIQFFSGGLFPLDILPKNIYQIFEFTPFPYLLYFPIKIYLGGLSSVVIYKGLLISAMWGIGTYLLTKLIWTVGIKGYTAQGR